MHSNIHQATQYVARNPHLLDNPHTAQSVAVMFELAQYQVQEIIETVKETWATETNEAAG